MPGWIDIIDSKIDQAFELTQLPQLTGAGAGALGRGFDALAGTHIAPVVERIGRDLPRMVTEAALTIPMTASVAGAPAAAATWANRLRRIGQAVGYGSAGLKGYAETDSPLGALIAAGGLYGGNKLFMPAARGGLDVGRYGQELAERAAGYSPRAIVPEAGADLLAATPGLDARTFMQRLVGGGGRAAADIGAGVGLSEASRQATMSVGPNAVGLDDPARNPFTAENAAANVANALPMGIGAVMAARTRFDPTQVKQMHKWIETRKAAEVARDAFDWEGPVTPDQYHDMFGTLEGAPAFRGKDLVPVEEYWTPENLGLERVEKAVTADTYNVERLALGLRARLDVLKEHEVRGETADAEQTRQGIKSLLDGAAGLDTPAAKEALFQTMKEFDVTARQMPPEDAKGFLKFVQDANDLIDQINENTASFDVVQKTEKAKGQTWHPNARSAVVVKQLQESGYLEKVTPDWLKENFNAEFDQTGDPQFAYQVVLQKVANRLLDGVPQALEKRAQLQKSAPTPVSTNVGKIDAFETQYIDALKKIPQDYAQEILMRAVEIRRKPNTFLNGMMVNRETSWRREIIRAMDSFDPETGTILIKRGGKYERTSIRTLVMRDEHGNYIYEPALSTVKIGEGGKGSKKVGGKTVGEKNIEELAREGRTPDEFLDEDLFKQTLAEEGIGGSLRAKEEAGLGKGKSGEEVVPEMGETVPDFLKNPEGKTIPLSEKKDQLLKTVQTLSDDQLYAVAKGAFEQYTPSGMPRSDPMASTRRKQFRVALMAALEDWMNPQGTAVGESGKKFLAMRKESGVQLVGNTEKLQLSQALSKFFGMQTPVTFKGAKEGLRPDKQRIAFVVEKLLDPKTVESVKKFGKPMAAEGTDVPQPTGKPAPAKFLATQEWGEGLPPTDLYNLTEDIPGHPKNSTVSADTLQKLGYDLPPKQSAGLAPESVQVNDVLTNTQPEGAFTGDVLKSFRTRFNQILGERGYSGSIRDLYTEMAVAIAKSAPEQLTDFYRISGKEWGLANVDQGRAKVGVNLDEKVAVGQEVKYANRILATLVHEISHIDTFILEGFIDAPDAFSERRRLHAQNLRQMAKTLSHDEAEVLLRTLKDGLIPREFQTNVKDRKGRIYGSHDPEEFVAVVNELIAASLLRGKTSGIKSALEVLDFGPAEVREYANGVYRSLHDVLVGMKETIANPSGMDIAQKPALLSMNKFVVSELFESIVRSAREATTLRDSDYALAQARKFIASTSPGAGVAPPALTPAMWFRTAKDLEVGFRNTGLELPRTMASAAEAVETAHKVLTKSADDPTRPGVWARWFYPFTNLMHSMERAGNPLARPMANLALGVEASVARIRSNILTPFIVRDTDGKVRFDQDNVLVKKIAEERSGPWRDALNRVSAWQQENGAQSMFVKGQDGLVTVNDQLKGAAAEWEKISSRLKPEDAQVVMAASVALDTTAQNGANITIAALNESNLLRTARLAMALNRAMTYEQALDFSRQLLAAYQTDNQLVLQQIVNPKQRPAFDNLLTAPDGLLPKFNEVVSKLTSRPGYRPESLAHEWVLRYETPKGETRYLSAETKHKANWLLNNLKREGMTPAGDVVKKGDLKNFTDFDDPDTLLRKFSEVEQAKWNNLVQNMEETFGAEVAAELKSYVPGAVAMKELSVQGLNQYLVERKNMVDRERMDYVDSTMSWAGRLAASVAFRSTRGHKDLILADPRSRKFPSFEKLVSEHFEEMMQPRSQWSKEVRTFSTAYMMGASLASGVVNGTQSVVSLVPVLIQLAKDGAGPVGAYKLLGKAVADATSVTFDKKWQKLAADAAGKDPQKWTLEEAKAVLYKRNVEDGGVNHGVILDSVFSPNDQKALMLAKFGHGNYGPVTMSEMVRNPVYLASQLSLKPFGWVEQFNNKVSLMSGIEQGYNQGLRGDALYDHAKLVKVLSTYGGGRANAPGLVPKLSTPYTRSAVGLVNNLQQYGYGIVATYGQLIKDSLGKSPGLSPQERRQAQKAFATMFATQVAVGGALGLPFAAASLTALEKVFGVPANQLVREGLASLGADDDQGAVIAETALNGLGNQMFGLDVSSRLGVSTLLGTSSYRGFNVQDMMGPTASVIENAVKGLGLFGQGEPMKATKELVPVAFKTAVELADSKVKHGDFGMRDQGGNLLYTPTPTQAAFYLAGFRPRELSQKRQAQRLLTFANESATQQRRHHLSSASSALLSGDPSVALTYAQQLQSQDPTVDPQTVLRSIVQQAVDSQTEKDLLATGNQASEGQRSSIARTFGQGVVSRQSETQRALLAHQLGAQVGLPVNGQALQRAALVDALVQQSGMPRSQALRLAEFLQ